MFEDDIDIDKILETDIESTNTSSKRLSPSIDSEVANKRLKLDSNINDEETHNPVSKQKVFRFKKKEAVGKVASPSSLKPHEKEKEIIFNREEVYNNSNEASKQGRDCLPQKDQSTASSTKKCDDVFECRKENVNSSPRTAHDIAKSCSFLRVSSEGNVIKRKFPGPAGLLPDRNQSTIDSEDCNNFRTETKDVLCSQTSFLSFNDKLWETMVSDYTAEIILSEKYNIQWIKSRMVMKKLINQKTPFLATHVDKISSHTIQNPIVNLVLKDRAGTIHGTILHSVYEEYAESITVGSIIVLKDVGVLNMGLSGEPYLTITRNNLLAIYTNRKDCEDLSQMANISKIVVQNLSATEILSKIKETKRLHEIASRDKNRRLENIALMNEDVRGPTNFSDRLRKAVNNAKTASPNLSVLRTKSLVDNDPKSANKKPENTSGVEKDNEHTSDIMNFFQNDEDVKEFFEDELHFTSTQKEQNQGMVAKMEDHASEKSKIFEDLLDGMDASALFDEF